MDLGLSGKRALVTGSSSGIGAATAILLAAEGARVIVHGRDKAKADAVAKTICSAGGEALAMTADLRDDKAAADLAAKSLLVYGGIDILINNAGLPEFTGWMDTEPDDWLNLYNNNVVSMVRMIKPLVPGMKQRGWGRIVQLSSVVAAQPFASKPHYSAGRASVLNMTVSLARELAETGITVNTVSPGVILTPPARKYFQELAVSRGWKEDWPSIEKHVLKERLYNLTGRLGKPEDVASLIAFLCSQQASYINGANYRIDGGTTMTVN